MSTTVATGGFAVRDFADSDYGGLIALHRRDDPTFHWDAADLRRFDRRSGGLVRRVAEDRVAEGRRSHLIGSGMLTAIGRGAPPQRYKLNLVVDPARRRRGVGGALCAALESAALDRGASHLRGEAQETNAAALAFLAKRGFVELSRSWESVLDVAAFDPARFAGAEGRLAAAGIAITTLADELVDAGSEHAIEAVRRAVHDLEVVSERDEPSPDPPGPGTAYEAYVRCTLEDPNLLPDGFFLARDHTKDGAPLAGLSYLFAAEKQSGVLKQGFTGVLPEYTRAKRRSSSTRCTAPCPGGPRRRTRAATPRSASPDPSRGTGTGRRSRCPGGGVTPRRPP